MSTAGARVRKRGEPLLLIAVGGFAGAVLRYWLAEWLPAAFPWGTLAANVAGAFLLGVVLYEAELVGTVSARGRLLLGTGFCASLTTYSTFAIETATLSPALAVGNVAANYALGFGAIVLGQLVVRWAA